MLLKRRFGGGQKLRDGGHFLLCDTVTFLGLGDFFKRLGVLGFDFLNAFPIEMDARGMAISLALQLKPTLLLRGDFVFQLHEAFTQLRNLILETQHIVRALLDFIAKSFHGCLPFADFALQDIELMPSQLRLQMLKLNLNLFVAAGLAGLTLERTDLALHLFDGIGDAQKILLGVFQLAERFLFLRFEFRDASGFFKDHPAIFRLAGKDLRDVALRQNAVARATDARAHEQLLDVLQPARRAVEKIFATAVAENPPCQGDFIISDFNSRCLQTFPAHTAERERNFRHTDGSASIRAVEDHVGHFAAAQGLGGLLTQHPADGVGDIGLAAAVRPDDGSHAGLEIQRRLVREGLKAKNREILEIHSSIQLLRLGKHSR